MTAFKFRRAVLTVLMAIILPMASANAVTIDMEGIVGANERSAAEVDLTAVFNGFRLTAPEGHFIGPGYQPPPGNSLAGYPGNGTSWFQSDFTGSFTVENVGGTPFSIQSFDATEWATVSNTSGNPQNIALGDNKITVTGVYAGTGSIVEMFITDLDPDFQTFSFLALGDWTNLESLTFASNGGIGFDNIEVTPTPLPGALSLFGTGLAFLGFVGWRRKRRAAAAMA